MNSSFILATTDTNIPIPILKHSDIFTSLDDCVNNPSPSNTLTPLTPPLDKTQEGHLTFDLGGVFDSEATLNLNSGLITADQTLWVPMSPGKSGGHGSAFGYNESFHSTGVSQERSTVSPSGQAATSDTVAWPPKAPIEHTPESHGTPHNMLPPLRTSHDTSLPSTQYWYHHQSSYSAYPPAYQYPQYPATYKPHGQQGFTHQQTYPQPHEHFHPTFSAYGYPAYASSSSAGPEVFPPNTAPPYYGSGTIQPSAFGGWHNGEPTRARESTISGSLIGDGDLVNNRLAERPSSSASMSERDLISVKEEQKPVLSPESTINSLDSEEQRTPAPLPVALMVREGGVIYTVDSEVKQTPEIKRMCFNCQAKSPPSWRKSVLNAGKILCNKCGIFERTHHRPRPPQNDDQKLRKGGMPYGRSMRDVLPLQNLQPLRGDESPLPSPYSTVPSQGTPLSSTGSTFSFHPQHHSMTAVPQSAGGNLFPSSSLSRRHTQSHSYGHQTSPYAHAYARRTTGTTTAPSTSMMRSPFPAPVNGDFAPSGRSFRTEDTWTLGPRPQDGTYHEVSTSASTSSSPE